MSSVGVPEGWYMLMRSTGNWGHQKLGLYCSVACLEANLGVVEVRGAKIAGG